MNHSEEEMKKVITSTEQITPEWLTQRLHEKGGLSHGRVTKVEATSFPMRYASVISFLNVNYSDDAPESAPRRLFLKRSLHECFDDQAIKEVFFYNVIADMMIDPPVVGCYDAVYSQEIGHYHLLLEDVSETHHVLESEPLPPTRLQCEQIIDCVAKFHAEWWDDSRLGKEIVGHFYEEAYLTGLVDNTAKKFAEFADFLGDRLSPAIRKSYEKIFAAWPSPFVRRLSQRKHLTLIHRDSHVWNYLLPRTSIPGRVYMIDWADWEICAGARDLAYMIALYWYPQFRQTQEKHLLLRYHSALLAHGVDDYDINDLWYDYRLSVIQLFYLPVWRWANNQPSWWHDLQRFALAFEDLGCAELLES